MKSEAEVVAECVAWLRERGWIARRNHVGAFQPVSGGSIVRMGETGECDWRFIKAKHGECVLYMEVEFKRPGKKPRPEQLEYLAKRKHQGFRATWADSLEMLQAWYTEAGYE
jgi:hypothetical protein